MEKETVFSYDIFDTLLTRDVSTPTDLFKIIEEEFPYPDFFNMRIRAQQLSNQTFDNIYEVFQHLTNEQTTVIEKLKEYEIQTEMKHTIPIVSTITEMANNSYPNILISDMYLSSGVITRILLFHGITQYKTLYVSSNGKHTGTMYETLLKKYNIICHTGDNLHSDILMANKYSIQASHTVVHNFTNLERYLLKTEPVNSMLLRKLRLSNKYKEGTIEYKLFEEQAIYNIPLLLFTCKKLEELLTKEKRTTVLFISRDGCLIIKLFSLLYPQFQSVYFHSSRIVNEKYTSSYVEYIKSVYDKDTCIFFDLHGAFKTGKHLWMNEFGHLPRVFIFDYAGSMNNIPSHITAITNAGDKIEKMNQDLIGTLCNYKEKKDIRMPLEHNHKLVKIQHEAVGIFSKMNEVREQVLKSVCYSNTVFWKYYYSDFVCKSPDLLPHHDTPGNTLTSLANIFKTDKGDSYICSHYYTLEYEKVINEIITSFPDTKIELLEIGLNRDGVQSIPSLSMWNTYFHKNVSLTGFDIVSDFMVFNNGYNIRIIIGDQALTKDLKQVQDRKYHMIIDDGYHASQHQQVSFQTLWENVEEGGYYIIEDLHWQPNKEDITSTLVLFQNWKNKLFVKTEYLYDIENIVHTIESINICSNDKLLILKKKTKVDCV
jgi:hypothetical protein